MVEQDLGDETFPALTPQVRFHHDGTRNCWVVQLPERVLFPDDIALDVLRRCDGKTSLGEIIDALSRHYNSDAAVVRGDVYRLLTELRHKGVVQTR